MLEILSGMGSGVAFQYFLQLAEVATEAVNFGDESFGIVGGASKSFDNFV